MHIAEGVLSAPVLGAGALLAAGGVVVGIRRMELEDVPRVAVMSSALFVASLIHLPGPAAVHLVLNGLAGVLLGWAVFPAFLVSLMLQAALFSFGGISVLGVNTFNMAAAALCSHYLFRVIRGPGGLSRDFSSGFVAGAAGLLIGAGLVSLALLASGKDFRAAAVVVLVAHLPVAFVEGIVTGWAVVFLGRVRPAVFKRLKAVS